MGSDNRAKTSRALKQPSAFESGIVRSDLRLTAFKIRVRASSSLIIGNHFNPGRFRVNQQSAIGNQQFFAIFSLCFLVRWLSG
jgi:hypothetical protein